MKKCLLKHVIYMTKLFTIAFIFLCLSMSLLLASNGNAQVKSIEDVSVYLTLNEVSVAKAFKELEKTTQYGFVFASREIKGLPLISLQSSGESLYEVLTVIAQQTSLTFKQIDDNIHVKQVEKLPAVEINITEDITISGTVTDQNGEPIPGVTVSIPGTGFGTATDIDGRYSLSVPEGSTLVFSFIGFESQRIAVGDRSVIDITLSEDMSSLDEVVVIGYGTQQKSDLTGAVGSVKNEALMERPAASMPQMLQGRIAGVNVAVNSGRPGGRANIRIRGTSSISSNNDPLYVIDGVILNMTGLANGSHPIDYINPENIASIEVLKDASATAIYGARGANGVILVTTKSGSKDEGRINLDSYVSFGTLPRKIDLLNSEEFLRLEEIAYENRAKFAPRGNFIDPRTKRNNPLLFDENGNPLYDTDWQEEATQTAITQSHQFSATGGSGDNNYGIYLGYRNEDGLMKTSYLKRYSGRFVVDTKVKDWITVGGSLNYNFQNENQIDPVGAGGIIPMRSVLQALPITPVKYPDGSWGKTEDYPGMEGGSTYTELVNERKYFLTTHTTLANAYINLKLAENLEFRSTVGTNIISQRADYYAGGDLPFVSRNQEGVASITHDQHNSWQSENYLTYNKKISDNHSINGLLGASWQRVDRFNTHSETHGFLDDYFQFNNLGVGSNPRPSSSGKSAYSLNSYFGRFNYNFKQRYLFTLTGRADGSSRFGRENQYAFFPSAAFGWIVSNEDFMKNEGLISNLKLRTSYGMTGNSEIPNYIGLAGLGTYLAIFDKARNVGIGVNRMANPGLMWEKTYQFDAGLELGLLDNRISIEVDVYRRLSDNMLLNAPIPASSGYSTVFQNIGSMENRGFELAINSFNISRPDFSWNTIFNISINKNEVVKLTGGSDLIFGGNPVIGQTIVREGEPVNSFFGFVHLGTWNTDEADQAAAYNRRPGDIKYLDINEDGALNDADRVIIGNGLPDGYGTLINSISYKNFELTLDLQFMYGNDVSFMTKATSQDRTGVTNVFSEVLNAWTPENQNTPVGQLRPAGVGLDRFSSTDRIYDGSFIRGRNFLIGYTFNPSLANRLGLSRLRLYASTQNFFLMTKYPGYDPEVSTSGEQFAQGMALYDYPKPRVIMFGVNIAL